jgi:hypothetical protein
VRIEVLARPSVFTEIFGIGIVVQSRLIPVGLQRARGDCREAARVEFRFVRLSERCNARRNAVVGRRFEDRAKKGN